ncbi:DUF3288 family protein [Moorena sp. SIO4G3]|uniref:DUF3288 family protein n=1 Tax=Moorena sp. SIO4G3 TaxID=2607821 RepID=UPI00142B944B|nr:DUF3288 family protein [Moorena sp. SIO4G3]NEO81581.1 DUF3288 family protein [Moorena sp. SIO4G3]
MEALTEMEGNQDQQHPQEKRDREIVNRLLQQQPNEYNLAELARLRIRYDSFPGARAIQRDLDVLLQRWQLTEQQLFEKTLQIHQEGLAYRRDNSSGSQDDWT